MAFLFCGAAPFDDDDDDDPATLAGEERPTTLLTGVAAFTPYKNQREGGRGGRLDYYEGLTVGSVWENEGKRVGKEGRNKGKEEGKEEGK